MPLKVTKHPTISRVVILGTGVITDAEYLAAMNEVYGEGDVLDQQLWNLMRVDRIDITSETLIRSIELDRAACERNPRIRVAVASSQDLGYGLARMWQAHAEEVPLDSLIVRTIDEAVEWLESQA